MHSSGQPTLKQIEELNSQATAAVTLTTGLSMSSQEALTLIAALTHEERLALPEVVKQLSFHVYGLIMMPVITEQAEIKNYLVENLRFRRGKLTIEAQAQAEILRTKFINDSYVDLIQSLQKFDFPKDGFLGKQIAAVAAARASDATPGIPETELTIRQVGVTAALFNEYLEGFEEAEIRDFLSTITSAQGILNVRADIKRMVLGDQTKGIISFIDSIKQQMTSAMIGFRVMPVFKTHQELRQHIMETIQLPDDLTSRQRRLAALLIPNYVTEKDCQMFFNSVPFRKLTGSSYIAKTCRKGTIRNNEVTLKNIAEARHALINHLFFTVLKANEYVRKLVSAKEILQLPDITLALRLSAMEVSVLNFSVPIYADRNELKTRLIAGIAWPRNTTSTKSTNQLNVLKQQLLNDKFLTALAKVPHTEPRLTVGANLEYILHNLQVQIHKFDVNLVNIINGVPLPDRRPILVRGVSAISTALTNNVSFYFTKARNYFFAASSGPVATVPENPVSTMQPRL